MLISKFDNKDIESKLAEFETKHNFKFPEQYRIFLLKYNGGQTPDTKFRLNRINSDIEGFYGVGEALINYNLFEEFNSLTDYLEDSMIPIASNSFGDHILIGIGAENNGKIYFKYHDKDKKYIELAEEFIVFVKKCNSEKVGDVRSIEERKKSMIAKGYEKNIDDQLIGIWQAEIDRYGNISQEKIIL